MSEPEERNYDVRATTVGGRDVSKKDVPAGSVSALISRFREKGRQVSGVAGRAADRLLHPRAADAEAFAVFNAELAAACRRGVPLPGALRALSRDMGRGKLRRALEEVAADVESGTGLADALGARPGFFPPAYVAMVRAGLATGNLSSTLLVFSREARLTGTVSRRTVSVLVYPIVVLLLTSGVMSLMGWTLLTFVEEWSVEVQLRQGLPALTELFLMLAPLMRYAPLLVAAPLLAAGICWRVMGARETGARWLAALKLKLPFIGRFFRAVALTRFCRTLASALRSDVPVPDAIALAGLSTGNAAMELAARETADAVREGTPISVGLEEEGGLFPATLIWMLSLGEARGEVAPSLEEYAGIQEEAADRVGRMVPAVVVAVVTAISAVILFLTILASMLPMFSLLQQISEF
ncbi:MAG: type II secretion system F family protein [Planctomycetota bacterium]|jgi:type II secretory pathway component PulF